LSGFNGKMIVKKVWRGCRMKIRSVSLPAYGVRGARRAPISYLGEAMAERTKTKRQAAPAADSKPAGKTATAKAAGTKTAGKSAGSKSSPGTSRTGAAKTAAKTAAKKVARPKSARSAAETERIRAALAARRDELREEYDLHLAEIAELQRDRLTDSAGDDQADTGSKTFEREQEISLAHSIMERSAQVERALERLAEGSYGWCERCGNAIPVERLAAFPSATLCVTCKQLEERR
jgi:DnaK suppressor protein